MTTPTQAEIVIIGGGIIGCSIAYHLTRMGHRDVLILEKSGVTHGATWHAAGLVGQLRTSRNVTRMLQRSVELYDKLEQETGQAIDWKKVGSLRLACSQERLLEVKRAATMAKSFGLEMEIIGAKEAQALFPLMSTEGVLAAARARHGLRGRRHGFRRTAATRAPVRPAPSSSPRCATLRWQQARSR